MLENHLRQVLQIIGLFHVAHIIQVETGRRPAEGLAEAPLGISFTAHFDITTGTSQRATTGIDGKIILLGAALVIVGGTALQCADRLLTAMQ